MRRRHFSDLAGVDDDTASPVAIEHKQLVGVFVAMALPAKDGLLVQSLAWTDEAKLQGHAVVLVFDVDWYDLGYHWELFYCSVQLLKVEFGCDQDLNATHPLISLLSWG